MTDTVTISNPWQRDTGKQGDLICVVSGREIHGCALISKGVPWQPVVQPHLHVLCRQGRLSRRGCETYLCSQKYPARKYAAQMANIMSPEGPMILPESGRVELEAQGPKGTPY